jgi:hypothetical protein
VSTVPIDFAAVADGFRDPFALQTRRMVRTFDLLARTVRDLDRQVAAAEAATRTLPLLRFRDGAVSVRVLRAGPDRAAPGYSLAADAVRGGEAFWAGLAWVGTAVRQELLIPGIAGVAADVVARVEHATEDVLRLQPTLFDIKPGARSVFELPALGALGVRVAADAGLIRPGRPRPAGKSGKDPDVPTLTFVEELPDLLAGMTSALVLAVPTLAIAITGRARVLSVEARIAVVDQLTAVEAGIRSVRARIWEEILNAAGPAAIAEAWFPTIELLITSDLAAVVRWMPRYAEYVLGSVHDVVDSINDTSRTWVPILDTVIGIIEAVTSIDLLAPAAPVFARAGLPVPSLTIGQLIDAGTEAAAQAAAFDVADKLHTLGVVSWPFSSRDARIWFGLSDMFLALALHTVGTIAIPPVPAPVAPFPDVVGHLLPPAIDTALADWLAGTVNGVRIAVVGSIESTAALATDLDTALRGVLVQTRSGLGGVELATAVRAAARFTQSAIGTELERQRAGARERAAANDRDPFLHLFFTTGFSVAGALVPHYLAGLQRFLRRRALRPTPTSPHVLARHGRLVAVRSPKLTVRAPGQPTSGPGANEAATLTAGRVRTTVGEMYLTGRRQLDAAVAELPRPPATVGR